MITARSVKGCVIVLLLVLAPRTNGQWSAIATGISGDLRSVSWSNGLLVTATSGAYYAATASGPWEELIPDDPGDAAVYASSQLVSGVLTSGDGVIVGTDTVDHHAVIFRYERSTGLMALVFTGASGTRFNKVATGPQFIAVGDDGLFAYSASASGPWTVRPAFTLQDLRCVCGRTNGVYAGGDSCLYWMYSASSDVEIQLPGSFLDVDQFSATSALAVTTTGIFTNYGQLWGEKHTYDGPIAARCVDTFGTLDQSYVGTADDVLYSTSYSSLTWQHQPTAAGHQVNDVQGVGESTGYAACNDGWLLTAASSGGDVEPYVSMEGPDGGCVNTVLQFINHGLSNVSWHWRVDGAFAPATWNLFYNFTTVGIHTVRLIGTDGIYADSVEVTFEIVDPPPFTSIPYTTTDAVLCEQGSVEVSIPNTSDVYRYQLFRYEDDQVLDLVTGNNGTVVMSTGVLTDSCQLGIEVLSALADCAVRMTDTIPIAVEHTKAAFLPGLLNAEPGEQVHFFNQSRQAATYAWQFSNSASPAASVLEDPAVSFTGLDQSQVVLIATSAAGCTDTLTTEGPFIYDPAQFDDGCWSMPLGKLEDEAWQILVTYPSVSSITRDRASRAVYISGRMGQASYNSRVGRTAEMQDSTRSEYFLARYDEHGVLKWRISGTYLFTLGEYPRYSGRAVTSRTSGDVFAHPITYITPTPIRFADGEVVSSTYYDPGPVDLFRADSLGRKVWVGRGGVAWFDMAVDQNDNLAITGRMHQVPGAGPVWYRSPAGDTTYFDNEDNYALAKLDANGEMLWWVKLDESFGNYETVRDVSFDAEGNVIVICGLEHTMTFHSTDGGSVVVEPIQTQPDDDDGVIAKYDANGVLQWLTTLTNITPTSVVADDHSNIYLSGDQFYQNTTITPTFGAPVTLAGAYQVLMAFSPSGVYRWSATASLPLRGEGARMDGMGNVVFGGMDGGGGGPWTWQLNNALGQPVDAITANFALQYMARVDTMGLTIAAATIQGDTTTGYKILLVDGGDIEPDGVSGADLMLPYGSGVDYGPMVVTGDTLDIPPITMGVWAHFDVELCSSSIPLAAPAAPRPVADEWGVSPNPTGDAFRIRMPSHTPVGTIVQLISTDGRIANSEPWSGGSEQLIEVNGFAPGAYGLRLVTPAGGGRMCIVVIR